MTPARPARRLATIASAFALMTVLAACGGDEASDPAGNDGGEPSQQTSDTDDNRDSDPGAADSGDIDSGEADSGAAEAGGGDSGEGDAGSDASTVGGVSSVDVPEEWPEDVNFPSPMVIELASVTAEGDLVTVMGTMSGDTKVVQDHFRNQLTLADYTIVTDTYTETADGAFGPLEGTSEAGEVGFVIHGADGVVSVTAAFSPAHTD